MLFDRPVQPTKGVIKIAERHIDRSDSIRGELLFLRKIEQLIEDSASLVKAAARAHAKRPDQLAAHDLRPAHFQRARWLRSANRGHGSYFSA